MAVIDRPLMPDWAIQNLIVDSVGTPLSGAGATLFKNLIARLDAAYPTFSGLWQVQINEPMGVLQVTNTALSGKWGFLMHIANVDPEGRKVVRSAGELLERFRISRAPRRLSSVTDSLASVKRTPWGEAIPDAS